MTEAEWLSETDPVALARFVESRLSPRKLRLVAVGFCRAAWNLHTHFDIRYAVESAERFADGQLSPYEPLDDRRQACREAAVRFHETWSRWAGQNPTEELRWWLLHELAWAAAYAASTPVPVAGVSERVSAALVQAHTGRSGMLQVHQSGDADTGDPSIAEANTTVCAIVRDVAGNPFRPVQFDPDWRTGTTVAVANQIYQARDFGSMPILADALQDAGCDSEEVLGHCRAESLTHVRGCWVLDAVIGKS